MTDIDWIKKAAKHNLMTDGHVASVVFVETNAQRIIVATPFRTDEEKYEMLGAVAAIVKHQDASSVTLVSEVFVRSVSNTKDAEYIKNNWDTERPSAYPESMRTEAICISHVDRVTKTCSICLIPFKKEMDGYVFGEEEISEDGVDGFLPSLFLDV